MEKVSRPVMQGVNAFYEILEFLMMSYRCFQYEHSRLDLR